MFKADTARTAGWILAGTLAIGSLDLAFAFGYWALTHGVSPVRILQTIASGVLGKASFAGGNPAAALGAALHYLIIAGMVSAYWLVGRRFAALLRHPVRYGVPYGLLLYAIMRYVIVPLSAAAGGSSSDRLWIALSIAMHVVFGVLCALFARKADGMR